MTPTEMNLELILSYSLTYCSECGGIIELLTILKRESVHCINIYNTILSLSLLSIVTLPKAYRQSPYPLKISNRGRSDKNSINTHYSSLKESSYSCREHLMCSFCNLHHFHEEHHDWEQEKPNEGDLIMIIHSIIRLSNRIERT